LWRLARPTDSAITGGATFAIRCHSLEYLMLLFVENSTLPESDKEAIRGKVCAQLGQTWKGQRVDRAFMMTLHNSYPADLVARFETADRLAPLMTKATQIAGNPRLIKRFLNALSIRMFEVNAT
jgi:predicted KAP-like P-loop ATPase